MYTSVNVNVVDDLPLPKSCFQNDPIAFLPFTLPVGWVESSASSSYSAIRPAASPALPTALETGSWNTYAESTPPGRSWEQTRDLMREVMTPVSHWVSTTRDGGRGGQQSPLRFVYYRDSQ